MNDVLFWTEVFCRWALGLQFLFWGLNGFFNFVSIPPSADFIDRFVRICIEAKFIMPAVKLLEIVFGFLLLTGYGTLVSLIFLGPTVFIITGLHFFWNAQWWQVVMPITVPYLIVLIAQHAHIQFLFH
ncbi:MAG: hypothetical protein EOP06_14700 [Proteobacteria bacterium]|nr:MAG: hypothetical protein EOP06_14700 [Pseudomonadota bacterium]